VIDEAHTWLRWTPGGWSAEPIPWPSNLRTDINHYIAHVVPLASTHALIVSDDRWIMTYDGSSMSTAIQLPSAVGLHIWGYTQDASGAYHVFWGFQEWISKPDGTWYPPAPVPIPPQQMAEDDVMGAAAIMRSGRVVVLYLDGNYNAPARHAHLLSRDANGPWTAETDITPTWAVNAYSPQLYAPPGGGVVANVAAVSTYVTEAVLWRSSDGISVGNYETFPGGELPGITGECLDSLVLTGGAYSLYELQGSSWVAFASHSSDGVWPYNIGVATLANGKTFWVLGKYSGTDYMVSP
jgi:hypothetical protein